MKDEIKEILEELEDCKITKYLNYNLNNKDARIILDYITNLQEENHRLKELCDKYEKEHSTTFNEWKETITDKYQTLKELQQENERLKSNKWKKNFLFGKIDDIDYKSRNEKANGDDNIA